MYIHIYIYTTIWCSTCFKTLLSSSRKTTACIRQLRVLSDFRRFSKKLLPWCTSWAKLSIAEEVSRGSGPEVPPLGAFQTGACRQIASLIIFGSDSHPERKAKHHQNGQKRLDSSVVVQVVINAWKQHWNSNWNYSSSLCFHWLQQALQIELCETLQR